MKHARNLSPSHGAPLDPAAIPVPAPAIAPAGVRPRSAVSHGVGLAGLAGLILYLWLARAAPDIAASLGIDWGNRGPLSGPNSAILSVIACGIPMVAWSLFVDRVHRNPSTGIDWSLKRPLAQTLDVSAVKIAGLWATWGLIALAYAGLRYYWSGQYLFAMDMLQTVLPALLLLSIPYILWLDRHLVEPRDGTYAFGQWVVGQGAKADRRLIGHHLRAWAVKGFFTAFMLSIVPGNFAALVEVPMQTVLSNPVTIGVWVMNLMFLIDVHVATVGYILTMKPLDAHIRTANPYFMGWAAALICYPPFILMGAGGPLDYHVGTADWAWWFDGKPALLSIWAGMLIVLTGIYAWATMAFGIRFSNLTHRGVITHGPYSFTRHPAYVSKNLAWWIGTMPFLVTSGSVVDGIRNAVLISAVSGIYYWRAKTEERHLLADPAYQAYWQWAQEHAFVPRLFARLTRRTRPVIVLQPDPAVGPVA